MYRFYKHGTTWYYKQRGEETSNHVGEAALEGVLGVTGVREVVVTCKQPDGANFYVTINNSFIIKVEHVYDIRDAEVEHVNGTYVYQQNHRVEKTEFYVEA